MIEQGICHICAQNKECLVSNFGWICRGCFRTMAWNPASKSKLVVPPDDPMMKVFVMMDNPETFITIDGVLYAYEAKEVADFALAKLAEGSNISGIQIHELPVFMPFLYVLKTPNIRLLAVKDFKERLAQKP